jgi:hypothetical protein
LKNRYIDTGSIFVTQLMTPVTIGRLSELYRRPQEPFLPEALVDADCLQDIGVAGRFSMDTDARYYLSSGRITARRLQ